MKTKAILRKDIVDISSKSKKNVKCYNHGKRGHITSVGIMRRMHIMEKVLSH